MTTRVTLRERLLFGVAGALLGAAIGAAAEPDTPSLARKDVLAVQVGLEPPLDQRAPDPRGDIAARF